MLMLLFLLLTLLYWLADSGQGHHSLANQIEQLLADLCAVLLALVIRLHLFTPQRRIWRNAEIGMAGDVRVIYHARAKPEWDKHEVLRLKALMPHTGCRKIADIFNRRFEVARHMTV